MTRKLLFVFLLVSGILVPPAWAGGVWLYEGGTPDLGTAGAGRATLAEDASTAGANPAGMTHLDRSQMLAAVQGLYVNSRFDTELSGFGGGDGGNAGGFVPSGGLHYVQRVTDDFRLGISTGSYFGLGVDYGDDWSGRYYTTEAELLTYEYLNAGEAKIATRRADPSRDPLKVTTTLTQSTSLPSI